MSNIFPNQFATTKRSVSLSIETSNLKLQWCNQVLRVWTEMKESLSFIELFCVKIPFPEQTEIEFSILTGRNSVYRRKSCTTEIMR